MKAKKILYLDHAATTPVDGVIARTYAKMIRETWANPSSPHRPGQKARAILDSARERAAKALNAQFDEVIFTASATEANNLAIRGVVDAAYEKHGELFVHQLPEVIISAIEHASVFETAQALAAQKRITLHIAPVDTNGRVDCAWISSHLSPRTLLVSVMWVNNEIGAVQEIEKIAEIISHFRSDQKSKDPKSHTQNPIPYPLFHTDAVQAFQYCDIDTSRISVDLLTLAGHKIYAPKGVGLLYMRNGTLLAPQMTGGGQERGMRSGTESAPLAHALSCALEQAVSLRYKESARLVALRDTCIALMRKSIPKARILAGGAGKNSAPHIVSILFDAANPDELLFLLDEAGIAVSLGSACTTGRISASPVLAAIGIDGDRAAVRVSFGRETHVADIRSFVSTLTRIYARLTKKS
jgi:cysteine desulfurase